MNINKNKIIYYEGDTHNLTSKLNVYILDIWLNKDIQKCLEQKYNVLNYNIPKTEITIDNDTYYKIAQVKEKGIYLQKTISYKYVPVVLFMLADVIVVGRVSNISLGLDMVDMALIKGKEVVCIGGKSGKLWYLSNHLVKDGATFV